MGLQPTMSNTALLLECQRPFGDDTEIERDEPGEGARYGSAVHDLLPPHINDPARPLTLPSPSECDIVVEKYRVPASKAAGIREHTIAALRELRGWLAGANPWRRSFWVDSQTPGAVVKEEAFLIHPRANGVVNVGVTKLPSEEGHIYEGMRRGDMAGTADLLMTSLTLDHKTGHQDFSQPDKIPQLKSLALIRRSPFVAVLDTPSNGMPAVYGARLSEEDHVAHAKALAKALRRIDDGSMRPGLWCTHCPASDSCPTRNTDLLERSRPLLTLGGAQIEGRYAALMKAGAPGGLAVTAQDVVHFHYLMRLFDRLKDPARAAIKQFVKDHPQEAAGAVSEDGKVLQFITKGFSNLSMKSIERAYGAKKAAAVIAKLRKDGAIETGTREELWAVKAD
jgi:hypothetical protein